MKKHLRAGISAVIVVGVMALYFALIAWLPKWWGLVAALSPLSALLYYACLRYWDERE
jgi:hypothetical protein